MKKILIFVFALGISNIVLAEQDLHYPEWSDEDLIKASGEEPKWPIPPVYPTFTLKEKDGISNCVVTYRTVAVWDSSQKYVRGFNTFGIVVKMGRTLVANFKPKSINIDEGINVRVSDNGKSLVSFFDKDLHLTSIEVVDKTLSIEKSEYSENDVVARCTARYPN